MLLKKIFVLLNICLLITWFIVFFFFMQDIFKIYQLKKYIKTHSINDKNVESQDLRLNSLNALTAKHNLDLINKNALFYESDDRCIVAKHDFVFHGQYLDFLSLIEELEENGVLHKVYSVKLENEDQGHIKIEVKADVLHKCN